MTATELKENFTNQLNGVISDINNLEAQIGAKKEMAIKLKGALEALQILETTEEVETEE
jgi:hypothetical protein